MSKTPAEIIAAVLSEDSYYPDWEIPVEVSNIIAALVAAGYKILPRELPRELMQAGGAGFFSDSYRRMWDAAP